MRASTIRRINRQVARDHGESLTFTRTARSRTYATGVVSSTPSSFTAKAVVGDYKENQVDGTSVLAGDQKVFLPAGSYSFVPDKNTTITRSGETYEIVSVREAIEGGVTVGYTLQVRR